MAFCERQQKQFAIRKPLFERTFCAPCTSASVERVFNNRGYLGKRTKRPVDKKAVGQKGRRTKRPGDGKACLFDAPGTRRRDCVWMISTVIKLITLE